MARQTSGEDHNEHHRYGEPDGADDVAASRPGRALASSSTIAEVVRQALSAAGLLLGDVLVVGAAGVGREPEREELRKALRGENVASSVVVTTDIEIALTAARSTCTLGATFRQARGTAC